MPDFETVKNRRIGEGGFGMFPDMPTQFALQDRVEKRAHLVFLAGHEKFHPAVAQIPGGARDVEAFCYLPDRIAETDSLDIALIKDLNGCAHANPRFIRARATASAIY